MTIQLTISEEQYLMKHFRIVDSISNEQFVSLNQFVDDSFVKKYLHEVKARLGTDYTFVAASQLMKRLGYLLAVPALYTMTVFNKRLNMRLSNCSLVTRYNDGKWLPGIFISNLLVEKKGDDRFAWREKVIEELFKNLSQIIAIVSTVSKVPKPILWENVAIYVYWLYEKKMDVETENQINRESDFQYLVHDAPGSLFGEARNPLRMFYKSKKQEEEVRVRRTCCFYYALNNGDTCCSTCPKSKQDLKKLPLE